LAGLDAELGNRRLGVLEEGGCLLHVELRRASGFEADPRDAETVLLDPHVVPGDRQALVEHPDLNVGRRNLGHEADENVIIVGHGGEQIAVRGLDGAAKLAP
jgi:hypothetical protein